VVLGAVPVADVAVPLEYTIAAVLSSWRICSHTWPLLFLAATFCVYFSELFLELENLFKQSRSYAGKAVGMCYDFCRALTRYPNPFVHRSGTVLCVHDECTVLYTVCGSSTYTDREIITALGKLQKYSSRKRSQNVRARET
jgi:hypothetical protein